MKADDAVPFAIQVVAAHLNTTPTNADELPALIRQIHAAVMGLSDNEADTGEPEAEPVHPAAAPSISIEDRVAMTVQYAHLVCLECGTHVRLLKPHVRDRHGLTVEAYMNKWGLPSDYPTSPPEYRKHKRMIALQQNLGAMGRAQRAILREQRTQSASVKSPEATPAVEKRKRGRPRKAPANNES